MQLPTWLYNIQWWLFPPGKRGGRLYFTNVTTADLWARGKHLCPLFSIEIGSQRARDAIITSSLRQHDVVLTLWRRFLCVIIALCVRWAGSGLISFSLLIIQMIVDKMWSKGFRYNPGLYLKFQSKQPIWRSAVQSFIFIVVGSLYYQLIQQSSAQ